MAFKQKKFSGFGNEKNKKHLTESTGRAEYDKLPTWRKIFTTPPDITTGYAPGIGGKTKSTKNLFDAFNKVAKNAKKMNKKIQEDLAKKGYKFVKGKSNK
jgi:hypothetical protein